MTGWYDARGNLYVVADPDAVRGAGIDLPDTAAAAARADPAWRRAAIERLCAPLPGVAPHGPDGLLVGPFQDAPPFDLLIVNTDGSLAERSGNGLTIFARALADRGALPAAGVSLRVHHDKLDIGTPVTTAVTPARVDGADGVWLDMGRPAFGPAAVGAVDAALAPASFHGHAVVGVRPLAAIDPRWSTSLFVRIGNPHCVTVLPAADALPDFAALQAPALHERLAAVAFAAGPVGHGLPCPAGVNLQWAAPLAEGDVAARIFERGEGATASSGSSATAVACAIWHLGLAQGDRLRIHMPGGIAPVARTGDAVILFGVARRIGPPGRPVRSG